MYPSVVDAFGGSSVYNAYSGYGMSSINMENFTSNNSDCRNLRGDYHGHMYTFWTNRHLKI
jgi:hypothetical protein